MNIEHKTTPIEHWIVDGKAYRLATEADVGKDVYLDDTGIENAFLDQLLAKLDKIDKAARFVFCTESGVHWRYAYVQDDSLLTPQRVPVPALGEGWFLLTDGETIEAGDMLTARED